MTVDAWRPRRPGRFRVRRIPTPGGQRCVVVALRWLMVRFTW